MSTNYIPTGYNCIMPYLIVKGTIGFLDFTQKVFGAEVKMKMMQGEDIILHGEINISGSVIMFSESNDRFGVQNAGMFIYVPDADVAYKLALENGATSLMPMSDQSYGRTGGILDPYGNTWWVTTPANG